MEQPYNVEDEGGRRSAGSATVAISDRNGYLLMIAEDELRAFVAQVIDYGFMDVAKSGPGVHRNVFNAQLPQGFCDDVRSPLRLTDRGKLGCGDAMLASC